MLLTELFDTWGTKPKLMTTATNGLTPGKDKLLGVCVKDPEFSSGDRLLLNYTTGVELQQSSKFHGISQQDMQSAGLQETQFKDELDKLLSEDSVAVLTYNVPFQSSFLGECLPELESLPLYDLTIIEKAIRNAYAFDTEELATFSSFYAACCHAAMPVPLATLCRNLKMTRQPPPGQLPMERMLDVLQALYNVACLEDISVLPS